MSTEEAMTAAIEPNAARDLSKVIELQSIDERGVDEDEIRRAFAIFDRDVRPSGTALEMLAAGVRVETTQAKESDVAAAAIPYDAKLDRCVPCAP